MTFKIEPIDLLLELSNEGVGRIVAGPMTLELAPSGVLVLNSVAARELAKEAAAYKRFFMKASFLADIMESQSRGGYVSSQLRRIAEAEYIDAKAQCIGLWIDQDEVIKETM